MRWIMILAMTGALPVPPLARAEQGQGAPGEHARLASVQVSGVGWWKGRLLRSALRLLETDDEPITSIGAGFVEDAVVILQSALEREGYLSPSGEVVVSLKGEVIGRYEWVSGNVPLPPHDLSGDAVEFRLVPGLRSRFGELAFEGLEVLSAKAARRFFVDEDLLLGGAGAHRFTPATLQRGVGNLREQLGRLGYADARVTVLSEKRDDERGAVDVVIGVEQGAMHRVRRVDQPQDAPAATVEALRQLCDQSTGEPWSVLWQQDLLQGARAVLYGQGFARAEAFLTRIGEERDGDVLHRDFALEVVSGPTVRVGKVTFSGGQDTELRVLERLTKVAPGDLFVPSAVERDRAGLGALGVFSSVRVEVDRVEPELWNVDYVLTPSRQWETSLLAGYGSYEQWRAGLEVFHANLFGNAHRGRFQVVQSVKSSSADYLYSVPQLFGTPLDGSARLFGLLREEVSFDREELGASVGVRRPIARLGADVAMRYQFESVGADVDDPQLRSEAPTDSRVASLTLDFSRDRRDNPLRPRRGMLLAATLETAATWLGGEVDYHRLELRGAWHRSIGGGRILHLGARHGMLWTSGSSVTEIPLAKRFFPGGENTIRGYLEGSAAPRNEDLVVVGAEVSTILNLEVEQALTRELSLVGFVDAGLTGMEFGSWPGDEWRVSIGMGLRFNTIIGPARLEYGYNIFRQTGDQLDEWHFALGFPF